MIKNLKSGFTLIELLVVISIIGILAALSLASFSTAQKQARDAVRKSDLKQYQNSLESYANKNSGLYPERPDAAGARLSTTVCSDISLTGCPDDPRYLTTAVNVYKYQSDGSVSNGSSVGTKYVLWGGLESSSNYWVVCSSGKSGLMTQSGWSNPSAGTCPLP